MKLGRLKKAIFLAAVLLTLSLTGCKNHSQVQTKTTENAEKTSKTGVLSYQYFYGEDEIALTSTEHFMYSDWEPVEFDYICTDPACSHLIESCSARTISTVE
ncbi:MAG: YgdI/YgdR family lipoprotein, partial [Muribaculaceae bacterium]|nr:YgdI/YgdR family lipoprotein [Muribaculaceae bacterium]